MATNTQTTEVEPESSEEMDEPLVCPEPVRHGGAADFAALVGKFVG